MANKTLLIAVDNSKVSAERCSIASITAPVAYLNSCAHT